MSATDPIKQIMNVLQTGYLTINIKKASGRVTSEEQNKKPSSETQLSRIKWGGQYL